MKKPLNISLLVCFMLLFSASELLAGGGKSNSGSKSSSLGKATGPLDKTFNIHDGNRILTIFENYGGIGEWQGLTNRIRSGIYPKGTNRSYFAEFSPIVGAEVKNDSGVTFHIFTDGATSSSIWDDDGSGQPYRFQPLPGYHNPDRTANNELAPLIAMSDDISTWPETWPTRENDWDGVWNGQYGKFARADQESYFVMNDQFNNEFNYFPVKSDSTLRGLGFEIETRGYQWVHPAAEDILIWTYWITNKADSTYDKVVFGMYGDADVGSYPGDQGDDDASWDIDFDMVFQWDHDNKGLWGGPPAYFGYKFLESPGNPNDGIDNDNDGMIDESQFDGIDNDGDWNPDIDDIGSDGLGPDSEGYTGPDADGTEGNGVPDVGEPNFEITDNDESDQIGLTSFRADTWPSINIGDDELVWAWTIPGDDSSFIVPVENTDLTFLYGSGYFPMEKNERRKFAIAMLFGDDLRDIQRNAITMQRIYDADYSFAKAPNKPILHAAVPGDHKVTLYWDDSAELSRDPIYGFDFEGYRIYRATDPNFLESWIITDAFGSRTFNKPLVIFDLDNDLKGPHPIGFNGAEFDMGDDSGLSYSYTDSTVENGQTYYYAIVSFDKGYDLDFYEKGISDIEGLQPIAPAESPKLIEQAVTGEAVGFDVNTASAIPNAPAAGYIPPEYSILHESGFSTATVEILQLLDPDTIDGSEYDLSFRVQKTPSAKFLYSNHYVGEDTIIVYEKESFATLNNQFRNILFIGPFKVLFKDVSRIEVDSVLWTEGREILKPIAFPFQGATPPPRDLELRFFDEIVGESVIVKRRPVNFELWNVTDTVQLDIIFYDEDDDTLLTVGDRIIAFENNGGTWELNFPELAETAAADSTPEPGSVLKVFISKPIEESDVYRFVSSPAKVEKKLAASQMDEIAVVPNPYVVTASWEPSHLFTTGRGLRKIDFIHLPQECTIKIFNMRGHHIVTLDHSTAINDGSYSWNMLSKDGLEISFGVYVYYVDAPGVGEQIGKFAVIK